MISLRNAFCAAAVFFSTIHGAQALTSATYDVSNATNTHGLWLAGDAGLGNYFSITSGLFTVDAGTGTALLQMSASSSSLAGAGFDVDVQFDYLCAGSQVGQAGCDSFELPQIDGNVDTDADDQADWEFFLINNGTLTGTGALDGLLISINTRPDDGSKPFRFGEGANWFDWDFGASGWFNFEVVVNNSGYSVHNSRGDLNLDLTPVPVPAGVWLLLSGLAGLGVTRKKAA